MSKMSSLGSSMLSVSPISSTVWRCNHNVRKKLELRKMHLQNHDNHITKKLTGRNFLAVCDWDMVT